MTSAHDVASLIQEVFAGREELDPSELEPNPFHDEGRVSTVEPVGLRVVTVDEFISVEEEGATALVGEPGEAVIPEGGDVMIYGDGGAGKTTLAVDLACHLAAGDDWLGLPIGRPVCVLLVENEGPRPLFRDKLRRKREAWKGSKLEDRLQVLEAPWGRLTFAEPAWREALAAQLEAVDVVIVGPVTRAGMNAAGTLQEVRDFMLLVGETRQLAGRPVTFVLIHHENKGGQVSGAWEGAGDTLLHVQGQGHGRTRLFIQKARWASSHHATALNLEWTDGEGFKVSDEAEVSDDSISDAMLEAARANGGASWNTIDGQLKGSNTRRRAIRDRLLAGGLLINANAGGKGGMALWHVDDPARPLTQEELRPDSGAPGAQLGVEE